MPQLGLKELDELKYFLKNIHSWRKFYTVAGCSGCAKSQLCCKVFVWTTTGWTKKNVP